MEKAAVAPKGEAKFLTLIAGLFAGFILISNLASTRIIQVGFLTFDAGTLMFPLTYIFGDLLTEVYGFAKSRQIIWTGFLTLVLATLCLYGASLFPSAPGWNGDEAWFAVMGLVPRLALASLVAYLVGEFANSMTLAKMKAKRPQTGPAWRFVASTLVGQFFDTLLFASIAFLGVLASGQWWALVGSNFIFKVGVEIVLLPLTLFVVRRIKKS
ncbi:MAG: queuosine precursor transporter, partial [Deltaproteobacteria bacterium]|nr:queuosine precursor transporter [Deltaproteobacteria bacterium]